MAQLTVNSRILEEEGQCAMRGSCGKKTIFSSTELPCPADGPASEVSVDMYVFCIIYDSEIAQDDVDRELLVSLCGAEFAEGPTCCTTSQLNTLSSNFDLAEGIISSCPACRNNFRAFWCSFTCSPDQATFLNVTSTQVSSTEETAVKSVDFFVSPEFSTGFFDSCKEIQFGATNGYAMDLIGGGAKNASAFLKFMGDEKEFQGSPFQINFPSAPSPGMSSLELLPRNCADSDLDSRCTCIDCTGVCPSLPHLPPPGSEPTCHIGPMGCLTFMLVIAYSIALAAFIFGYVLQLTIRKQREKYERVALAPDAASETVVSPRSHSRGLVGASSLAQPADPDDSTATHSESRRLGRGASLLDPIDTVQPRQYRLNTALRRIFYRVGLFCATSPFLTFAAMFTAVGLLNLGWKKFSIETDPVRLWVAPDSSSKLEKDYFDQHFGPFYRVQHMFISSLPDETGTKPPVLSWDHLKYWFDVEADIRSLTSSPHGYTLDDVCFKPAGPDGFCVVQSIGGWFQNSLEDYSPDTWREHAQHCAESPVDCRPDFEQPLSPEYILGGIPKAEDGFKDYLSSTALTVTFIVSDSLDSADQEKAMEWESALRDYLKDLDGRIREEAGLEMAWSTGVSLEEEISQSSNTDVKIVVLSYLAMFFYVALTLGNHSAMGKEEESFVTSIRRWYTNFPKLFASSGSSSLSIDSSNTPTLFPRLPRKLFVASKFSLGFFGIGLVILSVSSSVGLFSLIGVKVTLIIAEVIPFLVLAVGVDNVFILVHELDRQNLLHGPNASSTVGYGFTTPMSPTRSRSQFDATTQSHDESVDEAASMPLFLSAEERVARTLAKMGPSILLSSVTETVAFALGALVPMPAVRNFALYAAGSVLLNAILQVTVFVTALTLDLRRVEVHFLHGQPF